MCHEFCCSDQAEGAEALEQRPSRSNVREQRGCGAGDDAWSVASAGGSSAAVRRVAEHQPQPVIRSGHDDGEIVTPSAIRDLTATV
jgi:hypothetical protein